MSRRSTGVPRRGSLAGLGVMAIVVIVGVAAAVSASAREHDPFEQPAMTAEQQQLLAEIQQRYATNRHPVADDKGQFQGWVTNDVIGAGPAAAKEDVGVVTDEKGKVVGYYDGHFIEKERFEAAAFDLAADQRARGGEPTLDTSG
jgi:hypothetical protein